MFDVRVINKTVRFILETMQTQAIDEPIDVYLQHILHSYRELNGEHVPLDSQTY
jgi:hypothetical protein